jgi:uncharacterized surface anchored protein
VIPGSYTVTADKKGFKEGSAKVDVAPASGGGGGGGGGGGDPSGGGATTVVLESGTGDLTIVVQNAAGGAVIGGATVDLETPTGPKKGLKTSSSGLVTLSGTPAGDYVATVTADGFDASSPQKVNVGANANAAMTVKLVSAIKTGALTIIVQDGSVSKPILGAIVNLTTPQGPQNDLKTDKAGTITLDPAPAGNYGITASARS